MNNCEVTHFQIKKHTPSVPHKFAYFPFRDVPYKFAHPKKEEKFTQHKKTIIPSFSTI
ncbi:hypothetical protein ACS0TY_033529 [Phlomoides rotata]